MKLTDVDIRIILSNLDFEKKLVQSFNDAGGGCLDAFKRLTGEEIIDIFARNGLRMTYNESWHMDQINKFDVDNAKAFAEKIGKFNMDNVEEKKDSVPVEDYPPRNTYE